MPLVDESAVSGRSVEGSSAESLLLDALDLDDESILDDHADLAVLDALDGLPDLIQVEIAGG
jgi:hypothetical protein